MYCYIFGALPVEEFNFRITDNDLVIAADAGINNTKQFNILPNIIIGDFDSLGYIPNQKNTLIHPKEKDDTDTLLAIKEALNKGYKNFRIFGCVGGRLDHTIANIQAAAYIVEKGGNAVFYGNTENFTVIKNSKIEFDKNNSGNISVFALENCKNVSIKGLYYETENNNLSPSFPLGVSNKFINKPSLITVEEGKLLIIWESNQIFISGEENE